MNAATMDIAFDDIARSSCVERRSDYPVLRIALLYGEQFRLPRDSRWLQVLAGTAWVSLGGKDHVLDGGDCLTVSKAKDGAIVSALREDSIVIEIS